MNNKKFAGYIITSFFLLIVFVAFFMIGFAIFDIYDTKKTLKQCEVYNKNCEIYSCKADIISSYHEEWMRCVYYETSFQKQWEALE